MRSEGVVGVLCWPTMAIVTSFTHGLRPQRNANGKLCGGVVTAVEPNGRGITHINEQPAWSLFKSWHPQLKGGQAEQWLEPLGEATDGHVDMLGEVFERLLAKPEAITVLGVVNDAMDDEIDEIEPIDDGMRAVAACPAAASERLCDVDETVDEEGFSVLFTPAFNVRTGTVYSMNDVAVGQKIVALEGTKREVLAATGSLARNLISENGVGADQMRGAFIFCCATTYLYGGDEHMQSLAQELADAVGWCPMFGLLGGPEFGPNPHAHGHGNAAEPATRVQAMASTIVGFSSVAC